MERASLLLVVALGMAETASADSIVLGQGLSNAYAAEIECSDTTICLDSVYVWELDAIRTVSGPPVTGRVRALASQHTDATEEFVRSVELFVLRPIEDPAVREAYRADYHLVALSPAYEGSTYCLPVSPQEIGLDISKSEITVDPDNRYYCFARALVK